MLRKLIRYLEYAMRPLVHRYTNFRRYFPYRSNFDPTKITWKWDSSYNRIAVVNLLVSQFENCNYLEIGCDKNDLFNSVPAKNKIGVDPKKGGNFRATSDEFFAQNSKMFDVIFIDGLHTYQQCRKDFINSLKFSKSGTFIVLHDLLPEDWIQQHVPPLRVGGAWTGDVWKLAFEIVQTKEIDFMILELDHGVGVCRVKSNNVELNDNYFELVEKDFSYFYTQMHLLPIRNGGLSKLIESIENI